MASVLTIKGIDMMGWSKDYLRNPFSAAAISAQVQGLVRDFRLTHIAIAIPLNTQAEATAQGVTPFSLEPYLYAKRFTDAIHAAGKKVIFRGTNCYFEGLYDFPKTDNVNGTLANWGSTPNSWLARAANWVNTYFDTLFLDGDVIVPYPEFGIHWPLTNGGTPNQFFMDLTDVLEQIGLDHGKTIYGRYYGHLWTAAIQNAFNTQYSDVGVATYDHYGTSLGPGRLLFDSYPSTDQVTNYTDLSGTDTYSLTNAINEGATHKRALTPDKPAFNKRIEVYVIDKGTGDWTMTLHDGSNNPTQIPDHTNFASKSNSYQRTITNANLTNGAWNSFDIDWDNPAPDTAYHLHLTSSNGTGTVKVASGHGSDMAWLKTKHWKENASADAIEIDIRKIYSRTGVPQFLQEWGDYWSTDAGYSSPVRNQTDHETYLDTMYAAFQRLVTDGIMWGFDYWRAVGGHEAVYRVTGDDTVPANWARTYEGDKLAAFFAANVISGDGSAVTGRITINARGNQGTKIGSGARTIAGTRTSV